MNSARYTTVSCHKCQHDEYSRGTAIAPKHGNTWVGNWMRIWCSGSTDFRGWIGMCEGCHNVAIQKMQVWAVTLYKLRVKR